jgi:branched-chain amino acid transport system permease protein
MTFNIFLDALIGGLMIGAVYGLVAIGLTMIFGILQIINFAHGEFMMVGMYISYFSCTLLGVNPYLSLILVIPGVFLMGVLCERLLIKPVINAPQDIQILLTFGLILVLQNLALLFFTGDWRSLTTPLTFKIIDAGPIHIKWTMVIASLSSLLIIGLIFLFLKKTDYGKAIRACADDKEGALFVGLNLSRIYYITFGLGATFAGVAGALILPFFATSPTVGLLFTMQAFVIIVLGGLGSAMGALVGGLIVGVAESLGALLISGSMKQIITFILLIIILCLKPSGLFGQKERV